MSWIKHFDTAGMGHLPVEAQVNEYLKQAPGVRVAHLEVYEDDRNVVHMYVVCESA